MRRTFTLLTLVFWSCADFGQVFTGTGGPIQNTGNNTYFTVNVSGVPAQIDSTFGIEEVFVDITHPAVEQINISLQSPSGMIVELSKGINCKGANYTNTTFKSGVEPAVTSISAPYSGVVRPTGHLGRFNNKQTGNGTWKLIVQDWDFQTGAGTVNSWSIKFGNAPSSPLVFTSSNLPIITINTNNQTLNDLTNVSVNMGIAATPNGRNNVNDAPSHFNGKADMHIRGSSSKIFEKKSYKLELKDASGVNDQEASLLWMPAESDWVLTASYSDKTLIRNSLIHRLSQRMGHYSPRSQYVELILNGDYQGVYLLIEQPKRGPGRVNIEGMSALDNNFPTITGGYIIQINRNEKPGWFSLHPGISVSNPPSKFFYQYNYPNELEITEPQKNYIHAVMDTFETVMNSPNFADPVNGYRKYIDVLSFVDFFILNELSKNVDAYKLSTYLYKDDYIAGGKLHIGPMWDYDLAFHNCNFGVAFMDAGWQYSQTSGIEPIPVWWTKFLQDPYFQNLLNCRWRTLRQNVLSTGEMYSYIDQTASLLSESQKRNFKQFPILGAYVYPNPQTQVGASYATELNDLKGWLAGRTAWMDNNMPGSCADVGIAENAAAENALVAFPNPFSDEITVAYTVPGEGHVKIELLDLMGRQVMLIFEGKQMGGFNQQAARTGQLPAGTYIVSLTSNNKVSYKKLIKLGAH